jgi:hypothetical protein
MVAFTQLTNYKELQKSIFCFVTTDSLQFNVNKNLYKIIDNSDSRVLLIKDKLKAYVDLIGWQDFGYNLNATSEVKICQSTGINMDSLGQLYGFFMVGVFDASETADVIKGNYYLIQIKGIVSMGINPDTDQWNVFTDFDVASH